MAIDYRRTRSGCAWLAATWCQVCIHYVKRVNSHNGYNTNSDVTTIINDRNAYCYHDYDYYHYY